MITQQHLVADCGFESGAWCLWSVVTYLDAFNNPRNKLNLSPSEVLIHFHETFATQNFIWGQLELRVFTIPVSWLDTTGGNPLLDYIFLWPNHLSFTLIPLFYIYIFTHFFSCTGSGRKDKCIWMTEEGSAPSLLWCLIFVPLQSAKKFPLGRKVLRLLLFQFSKTRTVLWSYLF